MQAYNQQLLENTFLVAEAESLRGAGFISKEQSNFAEAHLPACQTQSNLLIRVGMFILGCILFSSCCGAFALFTSSFIHSNYGGVILLNAAFGFFAIEFIIREKKYFGNGIDDAFLFCSEVSLLGGMGILMDNWDFLFPLFLVMTVMNVICCIRYVDSLSAFFACVGITAMTVDLLLKAGDTGKLILPFALMLLAVGIYLLYRWLNRNRANNFYKKSLNVCYGFSMVLFYLAGNYLVVREATVMLLHADIHAGTDIPFAWLFYGFTFAIPIAYIWSSLIKKDRLMLWIGVFSFAFSIFTIRYYYHILPVELALVMGGLILFVIAFFFIKKLKGQTTGLTFEADRFNNSDEILNAEAIAIAQSFGVKPAADKDSGATFGGGDFGGGGGGGSY